MIILTKDEIEFLDQDEFSAHDIIVVSDYFDKPQGGAAHQRCRGIAKGNAYCYENIKVIPK